MVIHLGSLFRLGNWTGLLVERKFVCLSSRFATTLHNFFMHADVDDFKDNNVLSCSSEDLVAKPVCEKF